MHPSRGSWLATSTTKVLACAALLVLSLGLQRLLVVCTGPHCDRKMEFVHATGDCRAHDHEDEGSGADDRCDVAGEGHGSCVDVALALDTGPVPQRLVLDSPGPACVPAAVYLVSESLPPLAAAVLPPPTGPPRIDQRTELLASTLLLL